MSATAACQTMQCRVPRLAVRNPTSDTNPSSSENAHEPHRQEEHHHASEDGMSVGPGQTAQESCRMVHQKQQHQRTESSHQQEEKSKSTTKSSSSPTSLKSKTAANALSFFTLKEPSTAAWHDFAAAHEKQKTKRRDLASQQQQRQQQQHQLPRSMPNITSCNNTCIRRDGSLENMSTTTATTTKHKNPFEKEISPRRSLVSLARSSRSSSTTCSSDNSSGSSQKTRTGKSLFRIF